MAAPEADSSDTRLAPDDPALPAPWKRVISGKVLFYWNTETNVTQYTKPSAAAAPLPLGPPAAHQPMQGAFPQPSVQFGQVQIGQSMPYEHQASFTQPQQLLYQQQLQVWQPPNQYPQHMPDQQSPYMQSLPRQQSGSEYTYQAGQLPQTAQTANNQVQQQPVPHLAYSYNQGQRPAIPQPAFNHVQRPQMPHTAYTQGQQMPGIRIPQSQVQRPQQPACFPQPAQASNCPQVSQSQGFQNTPQQGQTQHSLQLNPQQLSQVPHVQPYLLGHDGKQTKFLLPPGQECGQASLPNKHSHSSQQQHPGVNSQLNISGAGGPTYSEKHLDGSPLAENKNMMSSPACGPAVNCIGPSAVRSPPPVGFDIGNSEDTSNNARQQQPQPELVALLTSENPLPVFSHCSPFLTQPKQRRMQHNFPKRCKTEIKAICESFEEDDADYHEYEYDFSEKVMSWKELYNLRKKCVYKSENNSEIDIDQIWEAYDAFLMDFPFSVEHWKKYADHERRLSTSDKVLDVYERAVTAVPDSLVLWCCYCRFAISSYEEHTYIRRLFDRALGYVGNRYNSSMLWDLYLIYEDSQGECFNVASIYRRLLGLPIQDLDWYFECFQRFVLHHNLEEIVTPDELCLLKSVSLTGQKSIDAALTDAAKRQLYINMWQFVYDNTKTMEPSVIEAEKTPKAPRLFQPNHHPWRGLKSVVTLALPDFLKLNLHVKEVNFKIDNIGSTTISNPIGSRLLKAMMRTAANDYSGGFCWAGMLHPEDVLVIFDGSPESDILVVFLKNATVEISVDHILADKDSWRKMLSEPFTLNGRSVKYLDSLFISLSNVPADVATNPESRQVWIENVLLNPVLTYLPARIKLCRVVNELYKNASPNERTVFDDEFKKIPIPCNLAITISQDRILAEIYWYHKERQNSSVVRDTAEIIKELSSAKMGAFVITLIRNFDSHAIEKLKKLGIDIDNLEELELMVDYYFYFLFPEFVMCLKRLAPSNPKISNILESFRKGN